MNQQRQLINHSKYYRVKNNLLYKQDRNDQRNFIRVIRRWKMEPVLYMFHNDPTAAHASKNKMMDKMKKRFYWPQMFEDIQTYVESCDTCQRRGRYKKKEPLHPIPVGSPFYQIGIDYVGPLNETTKGNKYIIVAMDYLTKWPEAKPVKEATAQETVTFIYEDIICRHGCPARILTDRGTHFNNQLLNGMMEKFQVEHLMSTPYHSQTNGLVERFNRTLIEGLAKTATDHLSD
jgi:Integrase zinc binding domain/Integrase core domain